MAHAAGMAGSPLLALLMRDQACAWARTEIASGAHPAVAASLELKEQALRAEQAERAQPTSGHSGRSEQSERSPPSMANAALLVVEGGASGASGARPADMDEASRARRAKLSAALQARVVVSQFLAGELSTF